MKAQKRSEKGWGQISLSSFVCIVFMGRKEKNQKGVRDEWISRCFGRGK
jgi:hypothetical protein